MRWRAARLAAAAVVLTLVAGACGGAEADEGVQGKQIKSLPAELVPADMLGLKVGQEDMKDALARTENAYIEAVGLYSLREGDLLQATLQVSRFSDAADHDDPGFRSTVVDKIGSSQARIFRVGEDTVYLTTGTRQRISVWFRDAHVFVLSTRDDYPFPRTLLREALEIKP